MKKLTDLIPHVMRAISFEYDSIVSKEHEDLIETILDGHAPSETPRLIQIAGTIGAGKTTYAKTILGGLYINFDWIMEQIPQYQTDIVELGSKTAFSNWEMPARVIGYEVLRRAIERRVNIVFDHGGLFEPHFELMKNLISLDYKVVMRFMICEPEVAIKRAIEREKVTGRHTPPAMITERFGYYQRFVEEYQKILPVEVVDTTNLF